MDINTLLFDRHPPPILIMETETLQINKVNQSAVDNYGYAVDEFLNLTMHDLEVDDI